MEAEEKQFDRVLKFGLSRLDEEMQGTFTGDKAFHLYETFGLPLDFMVDAARDAGIAFDMEGFEHAKDRDRRGRALRGRAERRRRPARRFGICLRRCLRDTGS